MSAKIESPLERAKLCITIYDAWALLGLPGKTSTSCRSPLREDIKPSFSIYNEGKRWKDHSTGECGDVVDFTAAVLCISKSESARVIIGWAGGVKGAARMPNTSALEPILGPTEAKRTPCLPRLEPLSYSEEKAIQTQRNFPTSVGVETAQRKGLIFAAEVYDQGQDWPCWIVTDDAKRNAQARRFDGKPFGSVDGTFKAKTLPGCSPSWPIGTANLGAAQNVILTEGPPDMLAAMTLGWYVRDGAIDDLGFACITGAGTNIDAEALTFYEGLNVRIVYDADGAGEAACSRWWDQLEGAGACVDAFSINGLKKQDGSPAKDLNDVTFFESDDGVSEPKFQEGLDVLFNFSAMGDVK